MVDLMYILEGASSKDTEVNKKSVATQLLDSDDANRKQDETVTEDEGKLQTDGNPEKSTKPGLFLRMKVDPCVHSGDDRERKRRKKRYFQL